MVKDFKVNVSMNERILAALGIEPRTSRMKSVRLTTNPCQCCVMINALHIPTPVLLVEMMNVLLKVYFTLEINVNSK